ncbi:MAG: class I SAM-dependent methyltransferase [Deltaproteobacteria bacterium]|nr:class I SAM-dependent methyltransferase [Deltaproteobacteria bacterium]
MSPWERFVVPRLIEWACAARPVARQRAKVVPQARGRVLELGVGSGLNFSHYDGAQTESVTGIDPSPQLLAKAGVVARELSFPVSLVQGTAENLSVDAGSIDTVVVTFSLCSIPDIEGALREARRVLRPDGRLLFAEHGLAPDEEVARWQRRLDPYWTRCGGGCHLDRNIPGLIESAGFSFASLETIYLPGPRVLNFNYWGAAQPT